jgi:hypothetical protein
MILADFNSIFAAKDYSVIHFFSKLKFWAIFFFFRKYLLGGEVLFECYFFNCVLWFYEERLSLMFDYL